MFIQQLYTNCLSEAAYYIESGGEAAIIDPLRDVDVYINLASERKATIRYIFVQCKRKSHRRYPKACKKISGRSVNRLSVFLTFVYISPVPVKPERG